MFICDICESHGFDPSVTEADLAANEWNEQPGEKLRLVSGAFK